MKPALSLQLNDLCVHAVVVSRLIGLIYFAPGWGELYLTNRIKILLILSLSLVIAPMTQLTLPFAEILSLPMALVVVEQVLIGVFIAMMARMILSAVDVAGNIIGFQCNLSNAFTMGMTSAQQSPLLSSFLGILITVTFFVSDLHFLMIQRLIESFDSMQPGAFVNVSALPTDLFHLLLTTLSHSFELSLNLSLPVIAASLFLFMVISLSNRLFSQLQLTFVIQPLQIGLGVMVIYLTLGSMLQRTCIQLEERLTDLWSPLQ